MGQKISYRSIPSREGNGYTALTIYPPGQFMRDINDWGAFVGGSGVGHAASLEEAKVVLLRRALAILDRRIAHAQAEVDHYTKHRDMLAMTGLGEGTTEDES